MAYGIDNHLLERATGGDREAMNTILSALAPLIEKQLLRYPVTEDDRRDLLQTALVQVMRRVGSFRGDASFSTWLFRVTANEALMMMRSQRRLRARITGGFELDDLAALPASAVDTRERPVVERQEAEAVQAAIATLPEDYREVVLAHYTEDLNLQEIAGRMRLTESAVRSRLHRARARLREELKASPANRAQRSAA